MRTSLLRNFLLPLAALALLAPVARADDGKRIALIIGNNNYSLAPLRNAINDARLMDRALKAAGFRTIELEDATRPKLEEAIAEFLTQLGPDDTALFFYAGHGVQIENENFLIPVDFAAAESVIFAKVRCVSMALLLDGLKNRCKRTIIILDACRSNPVAEKHSLQGGLAQPQNAGEGTYFAYSTKPGQVALDNPDGRDSYFSEALADEIEHKGLDIAEVFTRVRSRVLSETAGKQLTWDTNTLTGKFYFYPPDNLDATVDATLAEKWMSEARTREQREDWPEAIRLVQQVAQKKPGGALEALAVSKLPYLKARIEAQTHFEASEYGAAAESDRKALELDPFALDAAFQSANAYLLADQLPDAIRILEQIRVRGTTASVEKANAMLKALAPVEPEAGKALEAGLPQPPPIEEVFKGTQFSIPDFDAGARYLTANPIEITRWNKDVTAAMTPPAPPPPAAGSNPAAPAQQLAALSDAELEVAKRFFHIEIVGDTRDIAIRKIGANGEPPSTGAVQFDGPQGETLILMDRVAHARQVPARVPLAPGKYEIRTVQDGNVLSSQTVEVTPSGVAMFVVRSRQ
jgi:tetratricopeptide (TPR) repeat protein